MELPDPKGCNNPDIIQVIAGKGDKPKNDQNRRVVTPKCRFAGESSQKSP